MAQVNVEMKGFDKAKLILGHMPKELDKASKRAMARAITAGREQAVKSATKLYDIKSPSLRSSIELKPQMGMMISRGSPMPLMKFKVTPKAPKREVVRASVKRAGGSIGFAFIARMENGQVGVFKRAGKDRYPIRQLYSVSSAQMLGEPTVIEDVNERAQEVYESRLMHEVDRLINRY